MKKLFFAFAAVTTLSFATTSCSKSCDSCKLIVTQNGKELSNSPISGKDKCTEAQKLNGTNNTVTINGTTSTSTNTVTCD